MKKIKVKIKRKEGAKDLPIPAYATSGSSGVDLYADVTEDVILSPRDIKLISCGIYMEIPEGYEVTYIPEGFKYEHEDFMFEVEIKKDEKNDQVVVKTVYNIDHLILKAEHFEAWNEMIKKLNKTYSEVITFKKVQE